MAAHQFLEVTTTYQARCYILYTVTSVHVNNFLKVKWLMFCLKDEKNTKPKPE